MRNLLNQRIEKIAGPMVLLDESFSNETISDKNFSNSLFYKCEFKNIVFDTVVFRKSEFYQCRFQNCQILGSDLTRVEFDNTSFTSCEFKQVDLSRSLFTNAQFSETKFEEILLIGLILSDLKVKMTTFYDLKFSKTYPVRIHKLKKVREVSDSNSFQEILKEDRTNCNVSTDFNQLMDQLNWENQDEYMELIEEFLDESSNFLNFKERYQSIVRVGKELESNSISLKINYQALGFSNYILILIQLFESYQIDSEISSKVFKSWVRKILFEMKNHY